MEQSVEDWTDKMKTIYLLRHGEADNNPQDHARALTAKGQDQAQAVASFMAEHHHKPDIILSSDAIRTTQTAENLSGGDIEFTRNLYLASPDILMDHITTAHDDMTHLMIVAHNPGLADLALSLAEGREHEITSFSPATLIMFTSTAEKWTEVSNTNTIPVQVFKPDV